MLKRGLGPVSKNDFLHIAINLTIFSIYVANDGENYFKEGVKVLSEMNRTKITFYPEREQLISKFTIFISASRPWVSWPGQGVRRSRRGDAGTFFRR